MIDSHFAREKACYEQNFAQARSLNRQMNQVPVLAMTLTGGLWFAAGLTEKLDTERRFGLLIFAGYCNVALILAAYRIRDVFHSYLEKIQKFHPDSFADGKPRHPRLARFGDYSMINIYCALMGIGSLLSFSGALMFFWPFEQYIWIGPLVLFATFVILYLLLFKKQKKNGAV